MTIVAVLATVAWFHFTLKPTMRTGDVQALEYGSMKLSATENGADIGINGEIEMSVDTSSDGYENEFYPGASGSLTVWITSDAANIWSYILTYTSASPLTDESVFEKAKDICNRHILFFINREETGSSPAIGSHGNYIYDDDGKQVITYTYSYSNPLYPVGEYTSDDPVPQYRITGLLPYNTPTPVTVYWVWPYDYEDYGKYGDYKYLFPETEEENSEYAGLTNEERYDEEDSYLGRVVQDMRFQFYANGERGILNLS